MNAKSVCSCLVVSLLNRLGFITAGLLGLVAVLPASGALIADTFNTGVAGTPLHGRTAEVGGVSWYAGQGWGLSNPTGSVWDRYSFSTSQAAVSRFAAVPYTPVANTITTLEADLRLPNEVHTYYGLISFGTNVTLFDSAFWDNRIGQFSLFLDHDGMWRVYTKGFDNIISGGTFTSFNGETSHHLSLSYNSATKNISASIDGIPLVTNYALTFVPTITHAGVQFYGSQNASVDNFAISIPEPVTALILPGLAMLAFRRRPQA